MFKVRKYVKLTLYNEKKTEDDDDDDVDDNDFIIIKSYTFLNKNSLKNNKNVHQIRYTLYLKCYS